MENAAKRLIIALDDVDFDGVHSVVATTKPFATTFKVGLSLFVAFGPQIIKEIKAHGVDIFLDLKLHDIPMQVKNAVEKALAYSPRFLTVHAQGGAKMLKEVAAIAKGSGTQILAVSILTSLDQSDYRELGYVNQLEQGVLNLAELAYASGINGLVSSPRELGLLRKRFGNELFLVCPGVRLTGASQDDQSRVMSPAGAIRAGANAMVIGRPITQAANIENSARQIHAEIARAMDASEGRILAENL